MKRICMLLSMVMLLTSIIATPRAAVFADETSARADFFDTDANLNLYNPTTDKAAIENTLDNERGNVFFDKTEGNQVSKGLIKTISSNGIKSGKLLIGADVKVDSDAVPRFMLAAVAKDNTSNIIAWVDTNKKAVFTRGDGTGQTALGSEWDDGKTESGAKAQAGKSIVVEANKWTRVDVVVDFDNSTRYLYVDGQLIDSRAKALDSSHFTNIYNKEITGIRITTQNNLVEGKDCNLYFTNVRAAQIPSETTVKSSISGNDIYLWYNTAAKEDISDLSAADVEVQNVENRANKLTVSSVTPMGQSGVKVSLSDLNSAAAGEYRVVINKEIHDIFGNDMSKVLFYNKKSVALTHLDKNFDDANTGITGDTASAVEVVEDNGNNVLSIKQANKDIDYYFTTDYNSLEHSINDKTYTLSYRAKIVDSTDTAGNPFKLFMGFAEKGKKEIKYNNEMIFDFRNKPGQANYRTLFNNPDVKGSWQDADTILNSWENNKWYSYTIIMEYGNTNKNGSVRYLITDESGNAVVDKKTGLPGENYFRSIDCCLSALRFNNANSTSAVYIDDIKLTSQQNISAIKSIRFVDVNGTKYAPDATLPNDITKIEITADGSGVTADSFANKVKLNGEVKSGTFDADTNTYTIDLGGILTPTTKYTFTVDEMTDVNIPAYSTSFTTSEGSFKITDIKIVDESGNAIALANVTKDTKLKVVVEGINTTGGEKSAVVSYGIYNDKMLTGFDFAPVTFESTGVKTTKELNVGTITDVNNLSIKGFVWDSMKVMTPQSDFAELK